MILYAIDVFEDMLIKKSGIKRVYFDEHVPGWARNHTILKKIKRQSKFIDMDHIYWIFADVVRRNSTAMFRENLSDYEDFRNDEKHYIPILLPKKNSNYSRVDYFRSPNEPYLIDE